MRTLGRISRAELFQLKDRGVEPKAALGMLLDEAKARYPKAVTVIMNKATTHDGFDIIDLEG